MLINYIYFFVPIIISIAFIPNIKNISYNYKFLIFLIFFMVSIILIFRNIDAAADIQAYNNMYNKILDFSDIFDIYHGNIFFSFLMYFGKTIGLQNNYFFIFLPILYLIIYYFAIKLILGSKKEIIMTLTFFSITSSFILLFTNGLRQGLAGVLLMLIIGLIYRKMGAFMIITVSIFAYFSHFTVIPFLLLAIFYNTRISSILVGKRIFFIMLLLPFLGYFLLGILSNFGWLFSKINNYRVYDNEVYNNNLIYVKIIGLFFLNIVLWYFGDKLKLFNFNKFKLLYTFFTFGLMIILFTSSILIVSSRFIYYISLFLPLFFSIIFYSRVRVKDMNLNLKFILYFYIGILYGYFVYNFPSIKEQLLY